jgi:hypothetical protein
MSNTELSTTPTSALVKSATPGVYDPNVFQQLVTISAQMAHTSLIPETLTKDKTGAFPIEKIQANCFLIAEQAHRWGMSPFAVAQAASVVYGRLMWEGKLVAAVIEQNAGIRLNYEYSGTGTNRTVTVIGKYPDEDQPRTVKGSVADWKTDQWKAADFDQRLAYRGAREWARRHCPGVMLGVVAADEADDYEMRDVTPKITATVDDITPSFEKPSEQPAKSAEIAPNPPQERVSAPAPATTPEPTQSAAPRAAGYVENVENVEGDWIVTLKGSERTVSALAATDSIGEKANRLVGFSCWVTLKKRDGAAILTSIELKEEGGELL